MAPHFHDSALSHPSNMSQTSKPVPALPRIRPAIPLVFGRTKPINAPAPAGTQGQPSIKGSARNVVTANPASSTSPAPETERSASPIHDAPLTPESTPSTQAIAGIVTPPDTLSDRNPESEDSKPSSAATPPSSHAAFLPSTDAMETPITLSSQPPFSRYSLSHAQGMTGTSNFPVGPNMLQYNVEGSATHYGQTNDHRPRPRGGHHGVGGQYPRGSSGESIPAPYPLPSHNMTVAAVPISQPSHSISKYGQSIGYVSPTTIASPTAWNPAANFFVPPGLPNANPSASNGHGHGLSRSGSHSSSGPDVAPVMAPIPHPVQMYRPLPVDTVALGNYMISQFSNREFADFSLKILHAGTNRSLPGFPVHAVIIARSPTLHSLMRFQPPKQAQEADGLKALSIEVTSKFVGPSSILDAVGYLYGLPLPAFEDLSMGLHLKHPSTDTSAPLRSAFSLAGAGLILKLPDVMSHALGYVATRLSWETLDQTLSFVQESLNALDALTSKAEQDLKYGLSLPVTDLYLNVERFLVEQFPENFDFHASATELTDSRRLPAMQESRPSVSDPRLASIQFGAMPAEQSTHLELGNLLSSILLTVPTTVLQHLLSSPAVGKRVGWNKLRDIMHDVVEERERRRLKVIKTRRTIPGATSQQWEETNWEERLETNPETPSGFVVTRSRKESSS